MAVDTTDTVIVDTTILEMEEIMEMEETVAAGGIDQRRRNSDVAPPLDYVARELVNEFIESTQRQAAPSRSFIQKLFNLK